MLWIYIYIYIYIYVCVCVYIYSIDMNWSCMLVQFCYQLERNALSEIPRLNSMFQISVVVLA
jgi:hypothetical protein